MKSRVIIPFVICLFMTFGTAGAVWGSASPEGSLIYMFSDSPYQELYRLDETATALYNAAYQNNRQVAFAELQKLQKYLDNDMLKIYGESGGWLALTNDANTIETALSNGVKNSQWIENAVRIRLGTDALINGKRGLWLQYESLLVEDMASVHQAWKRGSSNNIIAAKAVMKSVSLHADRIEPAALLAGDSIRMNELEERIGYINRLLEARKSSKYDSEADKKIEQSIEGIDIAINGIFQSYEEASANPVIAIPYRPSPLKWIFFIGAIISAVLTWTGWRKYKQHPYGVKSLK
ncbi:hypothetical protein I6N90_08955 [Paenibacillus sp. GSMTC-2017]|uniref:sporulation protein YpjB n=1 Tax=Paenibacillus sp. GSMTC-2017 TaxID=2794350 RepID=UPI0018D7781D|nr:sporulation protein YpjB [Paenibacillus sp. GSMTC-2017]MBH5317931.1 hypothetical protein [Paenibacillus sp. GSMTC-2017]